MTPRTCSLAGASGLVGTQLLRQLLEDAEVKRVTALVRRPLGLAHPKLTEAVVDFSRPESLRPHLAVDALFCTLGTTIKQAGSQEVFRQVDLAFPLALATIGAEVGARQYLVVTAVGADAQSGIFYNRVKGELEASLCSLSFPAGLHIFHPSLLLGDRPQPRLGEQVASAVMHATRPLFAGPLARYRAIEAADVARAMRHAAKVGEPGVQVYEGKRLFEAAKV